MSKTRKITEAERQKALVGDKLTGKELFLRDKTLNESDLQFADDGMYHVLLSIHRIHRRMF